MPIVEDARLELCVGKKSSFTVKIACVSHHSGSLMQKHNNVLLFTLSAGNHAPQQSLFEFQ